MSLLEAAYPWAEEAGSLGTSTIANMEREIQALRERLAAVESSGSMRVALERNQEHDAA